MKLTFDYYCPKCKSEKTIEGSPGYYFERGYVHCCCHTVVNIKQKAKAFWSEKGKEDD